MFKAIQTIVMAMFCSILSLKAQEPLNNKSPQKQIIKGKVISSVNGEALPGAIIKNITTNQTVTSNNEGYFTLNLPNGKYDLSINYLGYKPLNINIQIPTKEPLIISLQVDEQSLKEVEIVSTGYQNIPKERATGSFTVIDNELLNRSVSSDLLNRLKGITNGLLTGKNGNFSIRGKSTIFSNSQPLIIVDNFPFTGDINSLNPEMIENVTVLKDAAAASIWGAFSGNGVIVITTKKGKKNLLPIITAKTDFSFGEKPNLYYQPQLTSSEYIDVEQMLFNKGAYDAIIAEGYSTISPVVSILQKIRLNPDYATQGTAEIDALRNIDYRDQQSKYLYRSSTQHRYFADVKGGGGNQTYYFSAGYDKTLPNSVALSDSRVSLKSNNSFNLLKDRLQLNTDISFSKSQSTNNLNGRDFTGYVPYEQLADANGTPLTSVVENGLRSKYTDTAGNGNLLDWKYRPLDEIRKGYSRNSNNITDYRINLGLQYKIINSITFSLNYQYYNANMKRETSDNKDSFYTRNLINTYAQINTTTGIVTWPVPFGDIFSPEFQNSKSNYGRGQLNFSHTFQSKHAFSAIAGYEIRDDKSEYNSYTLFGYNPETAKGFIIDPISQFPNYYTGTESTIGLAPIQRGSINRFVSWYGNASYIYNDKYIVSGSYRKDASNLFGVKANQKGVPLWSAGLAWNIHKESFFTINWLSSLQLKATYGYNGNVNNSISAYLTAEPSTINQFSRLQSYKIVNPPNENLRWERVKNINTGIFFSTKQNRLSGSIEYFVKNGLDLIAASPIAPQTGKILFTGNTANTHTKGIDFQLNTRNFDRAFKWNTTYIFNFAKDKITNYLIEAGNNSTVVSTSNFTPLPGYPINAMFAYKWAGLDVLGNPQGYLDGKISADYSKIRNSTDLNQLQFFGSLTPTLYGALRNTFSFRNIEISFNISYKAGYYFRRPALSSSLFTGNFRQPDYSLRWQKPGDERVTNVPSLNYPGNSARDSYYQYSAVLIEKGDHIRFQDLQINYTVTKSQTPKLPFNNINFYAYANNLGLLWRANKHNLDPDASNYPNPRTIAFGIKTTF